jgi:hypothetical protein
MVTFLSCVCTVPRRMTMRRSSEYPPDGRAQDLSSYKFVRRCLYYLLYSLRTTTTNSQCQVKFQCPSHIAGYAPRAWHPPPLSVDLCSLFVSSPVMDRSACKANATDQAVLPPKESLDGHITFCGLMAKPAAKNLSVSPSGQKASQCLGLGYPHTVQYCTTPSLGTFRVVSSGARRQLGVR